MRSKVFVIPSALALMAVLSITYVFAQRARPEARFKRAINNLSAREFHTVRAAQIEIIRLGTNFLPQVLGEIRLATDPDAKAFLYSLVGHIDSIAYYEILCDVLKDSRGDVYAAFRYPVRESFQRLGAEQATKLISRVEDRLHNEADEARHACLQNALVCLNTRDRL